MRILTFLLLISNSLFSQNLSDLSFGEDETLEVITWNIEWFPKNGQTTVDSVTKIIQQLDADIIALQEVESTYQFNQMVDNLDGFDGYINPDWQEGLAYVYKTATIEIVDFYYIFEDSWYVFPRSPLVMELKYKGNDFVIINNHLKCCGDGNLNLNNDEDEETRRYNASDLLKQYIDYNFYDDNVLMVGDLNDLIDDNEDDNVFQMFINDNENYYFTDKYIAEGTSSNWSYPNWPSHLDHILITNELFDEFGAINTTIKTIKVDNYMNGFNNYDSKVSDHRPVGLKIPVQAITTSSNIQLVDSDINISPNPANNYSIINIAKGVYSAIELFNSNGEPINIEMNNRNFNTVVLNTTVLNSGIYFIRITDGKLNVATKKLVVLK